MPRFASPFFSAAFGVSFLVFGSPALAQKPAPPTVPLGKAQVAPNPSYVLYNEALKLTDAGYKAERSGDKKTAHAKYEQARANYRKIIKMESAAGTKNSGLAAIWANLGLLSARENKPDAISLLQKATVLSPQTGVFWQQLAALHLQKKSWASAQKTAQKAANLLPKNEDGGAQAILGIALMGQNKWSEALPVLRKQNLLAGEKAPQGEMRLLYALNQAGKKTEAVTLAKKLAKTYPDNLAVQQLAGDIAMQSGNQSDASAAAKKAYALAPNDLVSGLKASIAAQTAGNYPEARKIAAKLVEQYPDDPRPHSQLGYLLFYAPDSADVPGAPTHFMQAEKEFRAAVLGAPKNASYLTFLGLSLLLQGEARADEAGRVLRSALYVDKNAPMAHLGLAKLAEQKGDWSEAAAQYENVLQNDKTGEFETRTRVGLAGVLYTSGKKEAAYKQLEAIADKNPTDTTALAQLASWQIKDNATEGAEATYRKIISRGGASPASAEAHVALGQLMEKTNRAQDAQKEYEAALTASPESANAALALGNVYLDKGEPQEAVKVYQMLLKSTSGGKGNTVLNNMVQAQLASVYETKMGKPNEALKEWQAMIIRADDPNRLAYQLAPARVLMAQSRFEEAIANLSALRAENPKEKAFAFLYADALEKGNKPTQAEAVLRGMIPPANPNPNAPPNPDATAAHLALGGFFERTQKLADAGSEYEMVLQADPTQNAALLGLSRVREMEKKPNEAGEFVETLVFASPTEPNLTAVASAQRLYQTQSGTEAGDKYRDLTRRIVEKYPKNHDALMVRTQVFMAAEKRTESERAEAKDLLNRLLTLNPADADANVQLGRLAEDENKTPDAIPFYTKALQINPQNAQAGAALRRLHAPLPFGVSANAPAVSALPPPNLPLPGGSAVRLPAPSGGPMVPRSQPAPPKNSAPTSPPAKP